MKLALSALAVICSSSSAGECHGYNSEVVLRGTLSRQTFAEQPNYKSIAEGDAAATYFFLAPRTPFCVKAGDATANESEESHIKIVQLVFSGNEDSYGALRPYLGKKVICHGSLFHAITGHHQSRVLLWKATCRGA